MSPASSVNDMGATPDGWFVNECVHGPAVETFANGTTLMANGTSVTFPPCPQKNYITNGTGWISISRSYSSYYFVADTDAATIIPTNGSQVIEIVATIQSRAPGSVFVISGGFSSSSSSPPTVNAPSTVACIGQAIQSVDSNIAFNTAEAINIANSSSAFQAYSQGLPVSYPPAPVQLLPSHNYAMHVNANGCGGSNSNLVVDLYFRVNGRVILVVEDPTLTSVLTVADIGPAGSFGA